MDLGLDPGSENSSRVTFEKSLGLSGLCLLGRNLPPPSPHIPRKKRSVFSLALRQPLQSDLQGRSSSEQMRWPCW